jgi:hypothetical protein
MVEDGPDSKREEGATDALAVPAPTKVAEGSVHVRIVCAILASAARLVPVPLVDDILRERVTQIVVKQTLAAQGRTYSSNRLRPIWSDSTGCASGCVLMILKLPLILITYPFRKVWAWMMAVRYLSRDLTTMILLGRALDRSLEVGRLTDGEGLEAEAAMWNRAFENAVGGMDTKVLTSGLATALSGVKGIGGAAVRTLRSLWRKRQSGSVTTVEVPQEERATMDAGARSVEAALAKPEIVALLERFDTRFEENLKVLASRNPG